MPRSRPRRRRTARRRAAAAGAVDTGQRFVPRALRAARTTAPWSVVLCPSSRDLTPGLDVVVRGNQSLDLVQGLHRVANGAAARGLDRRAILALDDRAVDHGTAGELQRAHDDDETIEPPTAGDLQVAG